MKPRLTLEPYCGTGPLWWHCRAPGYMSCAPTPEEAFSMWERHINPPPPKLTRWQRIKRFLDQFDCDPSARVF